MGCLNGLALKQQSAPSRGAGATGPHVVQVFCAQFQGVPTVPWLLALRSLCIARACNQVLLTPVGRAVATVVSFAGEGVTSSHCCGQVGARPAVVDARV